MTRIREEEEATRRLDDKRLGDEAGRFPGHGSFMARTPVRVRSTG